MKRPDLTKYKLRIRMTITNTLLAALPLIIFSVITYGVFINDSNRLITSTLESTFDQMSDRLDEHFENVDMMIKSFAFEDSVQRILSSDPDFTDSSLRNQLTGQLKNVILLNSAVSDGYVVTSSGKIAGSSENVSKDDVHALVEKARKSGKATGYLTLNNAENKPLIAVAEQIYNPESYDYLGYAVMVIDEEKLLKIFDTKIYGADMQFLILDSEGNPIVLPNPKIDIPVAEMHKSIPIKEKKYSSSFKSGKTEYKYIIHKSDETDWEIAVVVSKRDLYNNSLHIGYSILLYILIIILIVVALTTFTNFRITKPITRLSQAIDRVASGDFKHKISFSEKNEITMIADNFNHMVDEVQALTKKIFNTQQRLYETELERKQFEVSLLHSQINSHFLYNTLSCIRGMSRSGAEKEVSAMISCLVSMLRYASNLQDKSVLQDEFLNIKNYVYIQRMRLGEQLQLIFGANDDILSCEIPKMTLQPVVENSILHGFTNQKGSWIIRVTAKKIANGIEIRVTDNGIGIDKETLSALNRSLAAKRSIYDTSGEKTSIGLVNIQNRIHSLYGEAFGVHVHSWEGYGTVVVIQIPNKRSDDYVFGRFDR